MDRIIGPFGFSDKDPQGLQIEGFGHLPVIATPINPEWLPPLVESCGYAPFEDMVSYRMDIPAQLPEVYLAIGERCLRNHGLHRVPLRSKRELKPCMDKRTPPVTGAFVFHVTGVGPNPACPPE